MGLFYFFSGIGSFLGSALLSCFSGVWFFSGDHGNINCRKDCFPADNCIKSSGTCHLDYYFFLLAGIQFLGMVVFYFINRWLKLSDDPAVLGTENVDEVENHQNSVYTNSTHSVRPRIQRTNYGTDNSRPNSRPTSRSNSRPKTPMVVNDGDEGTTTESSTNEMDGQRLRNVANKPLVQRSIRKDVTGRIGIK